MTKWSWREESNPRPPDYKSDALPTELRQLYLRVRSESGEGADDGHLGTQRQEALAAFMAKPSKTRLGRHSPSRPSDSRSLPAPPVTTTR